MSNVSSDARKIFHDLLAEIDANMFELETESRLCAIAALSRCHILMIGLPGVGKSLLGNCFIDFFSDFTCYEQSLDRQMPADKLIGFIPPSSLRNDTLRIKTDGFVPKAQIVVLDEIFKGPPSALHSLLTIFDNSRKFHNAGVVEKSPLISCYGLSNELPAPEDNLGAMVDRFTIRRYVNPIQDADKFRQMLLAPEFKIQTRITQEQLKAAQESVKQVKVPPETLDAYDSIRFQLEDEKITASPRRWRQMLKVLRAHAWLDGYDEIYTESLTIMPDCLWERPQDRSRIAQVINGLASPIALEAEKLRRACQDTCQQIKDSETRGQKLSLDKMAQFNKELRGQLKSISGLNQTHPVVTEVKREIQAAHTRLSKRIMREQGLVV